MTSNAPIAIFIYKRPDHLRLMLNDLRRCEGFEQSRLFVFADGPKTHADINQAEAARAVAKELLGERVSYRFSDQNKGLARSIIDGVNELTDTFGRAIVIEDDLSLSPFFLRYMNAALDRYEDAESVYQVSGHMFDVPQFTSRSSALLLPFTTTWGWGTWRRAWQYFDPACTGWEVLANDHLLRSTFNLDGSYDYYSMLERQMRGQGNSWGIKWYWNVFTKFGLTVYPPQTLVGNHGMDGSGTNGLGLFRKFRSSVVRYGDAPSLPEPFLDTQAFEVVKAAIYRQNGGIIGKTVDRIKRFV